MENKKYKGMIGLDLDGTALDENKKLRPRVRQAIEEAIADGFVVLPVSGRPIKGLSNELMSVPGVEYAITSNGAVSARMEDFEAGKWEELVRIPLADEKIDEILEILKDFECIPDCFIGGRGNMPKRFQEEIKEWGLRPGILAYILENRGFHEDWIGFVKSHPGETVKMTISFNMTKDGAEQKEKAKKALEQIPGIMVVSGAVHNIEVSDETTGKGKGMMKLCEVLGIDPANTMGCGDEGNDMEMVQMAAFGVAMGNAVPEIKEAADYITLSNEEDGVAFAIEEFRRRINAKPGAE